jgi:hypothetical protein
MFNKPAMVNAETAIKGRSEVQPLMNKVRRAVFSFPALLPPP